MQVGISYFIWLKRDQVGSLKTADFFKLWRARARTIVEKWNAQSAIGGGARWEYHCGACPRKGHTRKFTGAVHEAATSGSAHCRPIPHISTSDSVRSDRPKRPQIRASQFDGVRCHEA